MRTLEGKKQLALAGAAIALALLAASLVRADPASAAFRDIRVHFTNNSDSTLTRASGTLDHGCWVEEPPAKIEIDQTVDIASESWAS